MATMKPTLCGGRAVHAPDCGEDGNCEYYAERAEAWAVGTVGGDPVPSYDLAYENNSKYWAEQSALSASESAESAIESTESATQAKGYAETAEQAAEEVTNALGQVMSKTTGIFTQTFTTSTDTSTLTFNPTGYTYSANDDFDVYISGLRLNPSEFSWTGSGSSATITLVTPVTHTGTVIEVVANTSSQMTTDATLTIQGAAADAKATGDEINQLKEDIADIDALSDDVKNALLECFEHVAWIDNQGQNYYDALEHALYPRELVSISAVFDSQGTTIYADEPLNDLKQYLTVTAHYNDSTTVIVTDYTLSGTLSIGANTITVSYNGKTTTFNVTAVGLVSISAVFDAQGTTIYTDDSLDSLKQYLTVTANYSDSSTGVVTDYTLSGSLTEGTSTITVSYSEKTTTFTVSVVDFYNIWEWSLENGMLQIINGSSLDRNANVTSRISIRTDSATVNRKVESPTQAKGYAPYYTYSGNQRTDYYPIPIPKEAEKVTVSITPNTQYVYAQACYFEDGVYKWDTWLKSSGWQQGSAELIFGDDKPEKTVLLWGMKYDSAGTSYPTAPTNISAVFE